MSCFDNKNNDTIYFNKEEILDEALMNDAKAYFGTTTSPKETFYINTDGTMLDGSGKRFGGPKGRRTTDHREVNYAWEDNPIFSSGYEAMVAYMNEGNIRYMPELNGFDIIKKPTPEQYNTMENILYRVNDECTIDFSDEHGNVVDSVYFEEGESVKKIIATIKRYFIDNITESKLDEDIIEKQDADNNDLSPEQIEYFKNSKIRDAQGRLLVCYHGTTNETFTEFNPTDKKSQFGKYKFNTANVNYFTTDFDSAASYTELGYGDDSNIFACYLNIENPFIVNNITEAKMKNSFNIKDERIRKKQLELFKTLWYRYSGDVDEDDLADINRLLFPLNKEIRPAKDRTEDSSYGKEPGYYDLYDLGNNSFWGNEKILLYSYTLDELFDEDMYEEMWENIIGEDEDDYYLSTDDIVRYVLELNNEDGTQYDGIIIPDIIDSKSMFSNITTDIITIKSANQIKLIKNKTPSSSNNINEEAEDDGHIETYSTGAYSGQTDMIKTYVIDGKIVGTLSYAIYEDQPNIQMLEVKPEYRRKGIATKLMRSLQSDFPKTPINMGYALPDGVELLNKIATTKKNGVYTRAKNQYDKNAKEIEDIEKGYDQLYDELDAIEDENSTEFEDCRQKLLKYDEKYGERLNNLHNQQHNLEQKIWNTPKEFTYVKMNEALNGDATILYHSTPYKNVKAILKDGIKVSSSTSEIASGYQMIWATTHPLKNDDYGGTIIKFALPENVVSEKVNDDQYIIYDDIPVDYILGVDVLIGESGTGYMHQSELPAYIKEYGEEKVKKVLLKHHSEQITDEELKQLTPELNWNTETQQITEGFEALGSVGFCTDSEYDVRNLIINKPQTYRILYDKNLDLYMVGDGNKVVHFDLLKAAIKAGFYYKPNKNNAIDYYYNDTFFDLFNYYDSGRWGIEEDEFSCDSYLYWIVFSNDQNEIKYWETDDYDDIYSSDIGYFATRDCVFEDTALYQLFTKYNIKKIKGELTEKNKNKKQLEENLQPFELEAEKSRIRDVLDIMKDIEYGFYSKIDGKKITDREWIHNCDTDKYYKVNTDPLKTINDKLGICQDQAIATKYLMNKYHPEDEVKLYALTKDEKGHCVPCYCHEGKWYYLENSWDKEKGLHGYFDSEDELKDYLQFMYQENHKEDTPKNSEVNMYDYKIPTKLTEDTRSQLTTKSRNADYYKHNIRGKNRWERKKYSKPANQVKSYNSINMDDFFRKDILIMNIPVVGETDEYTVSVQLEGVCAEIAKNIRSNNNKFEFKTVIQAITKVFNTGEVKVKCNCKDFQFRFAHQLIVNGNSIDDTSKDPGPGKTGMANTTGKGCKHILNVLNNQDFLIKVASVIRNYINYAQEHLQQAFIKVIFPKLYGISAEDAQTNGIIPEDIKLESEKHLIDVINDWAKNRGKIQKGTKTNPVADKRKPAVINDKTEQ